MTRTGPALLPTDTNGSPPGSLKIQVERAPVPHDAAPRQSRGSAPGSSLPCVPAARTRPTGLGGRHPRATRGAPVIPPTRLQAPAAWNLLASATLRAGTGTSGAAHTSLPVLAVLREAQPRLTCHSAAGSPGMS